MYHLSCIFLLFVAALAIAVPMGQPPPGFTTMEQKMITGLLEKHKLRDIIRVILMVEERRLVKQPTASTTEAAKTEIVQSVPRQGLPMGGSHEPTNVAMLEKRSTTPPTIPRRRFYDEDVWQQTMAEI
ncbi:hypothetical protein TcWFU_001859 [Taenia crassiceps]|uniref:Uncharacterized protein n=1 Tax=Taenia crassiceps TaxID=6207 RepID=A0ABR4QJE2_9CEST